MKTHQLLTSASFEFAIAQVAAQTLRFAGLLAGASLSAAANPSEPVWEPLGANSPAP
jgi:hypothetical protein